MVRVRIYGCPDIEVRERYRRVVEFYIKKLLPRIRNLSVSICFDKTLYKKQGMFGSCLVDDYPKNHRHRKFIVHVYDRMKFTRKVAILAHEIAHVKQYASGEMSYDYSDGLTIWKGGKYTDDHFEYYDSPWEEDARMYEVILSHELLNNKQIWK